jgi:hypothetical protein
MAASTHWASLIEDLETRELSGEVEGDHAVDSYAVLLLAYLATGQEASGQLLVKRCPPALLGVEPMVSARKLLVRAMRLEYVEFFAEIAAAPWGTIAQTAQDAALEIRLRLFDGLEKAYSALQPSTLSKMVGLPEADARAQAIGRGWTEDAEGIHPPSKRNDTDFVAGMDTQLEKLTTIVGFLEAHSWK